MAELLAGQGHEVIFIDNASTYEPLLDYYSKTEFQIIRLTGNHGNVAAWTQGIVTTLDEPYIVSDPDFDLSMIPADWPQVLMAGFQEHPGQVKYCFSWDESQVPPENPAWILDEMYKYPEGHPATWGRGMAHNWYNYPGDTCFAIYPPHVPFYIGGIRKGRPYTGVHLPWHLTIEPSKDTSKRHILMDDEHYYYFTHCENSSFTWARVIETGMLAEYEKKNGIEVPYKWRGAE
jgi:hypothetical protein